MFKLIRRLLTILIIIMLFVVSIFAGWGYFSYKEVVEEVSIEEKVEIIRSSDHYVNIDDVSDHFKNAIVAIEDHRFYSHHGIDYISLVRITLANIMAQEVLGGGSTITQQLAKNMYFDQSLSMNRKISEAFVANALENKYSKEEILELYINCIYYGDGYYGIYDASMGYFNVEPSQLTIEQGSMLAGLPQAPSAYALSKHYDVAQKRQVEVLNAMLEYDYITQEQYKYALANEVR